MGIERRLWPPFFLLSILGSVAMETFVKPFYLRPGFLALQALIILLPLPLGANRIWALLLLIPFSVFVLTLAWVAAWRDGTLKSDLRHARPILLFLAAFAGWCVLAIVPLPQNILEVIAPLSATAWKENPTTDPRISVDVQSTVIYIATCAMHFCAFLATSLWCRNWDATRQIAYTVVVSGIIQAVTGTFLLGIGASYDLFDDHIIHEVAKGTFANRNHFAAYLVLCISIAVGLLLGSRSTKNANLTTARARFKLILEVFLSGKATIRVLMVAMIVGVVLSRSRMGNAAMIFALITILLAYTYYVAKQKTTLLLLLGSFLVVDLLIIGQWIGIDKVADRISNTTLTEAHIQEKQVDQIREESLFERWKVAKASLRIFAESPITGTGGGTFVTAYMIWGDPVAEGHYMPAAHCDYAEFLLETGAVGTGLLALIFLLPARATLRVFLDATRRTKYRAFGAGILMAMLALALHASVEFIFQIPAIAATFCILLALAWTLPKVSRNGETD